SIIAVVIVVLAIVTPASVILSLPGGVELLALVLILAETLTHLGWTVYPINHRSGQAALEGFRLAPPVGVGARDHHSAKAPGDGDQLLGVRLPTLNIQQAVANVLEVDEQRDFVLHVRRSCAGVTAYIVMKGRYRSSETGG